MRTVLTTLRAPAIRQILAAMPLLLWAVVSIRAASPEVLFRQGTEAYRAADYASAVLAFAAAAGERPAAGTLQNLGNAQWQCGRTGRAILAWEQALALDPFNRAVQGNLRFARKNAQLESPQLAWYEVVATWLPLNQWVWVASLSLWLALALVLLPGIFRLSKASWHQAVAAVGLAVFLLSIPALYGVATRARIGFVLEKETPLRLTPTEDGQVITQLSAGDPARLERSRGKFILVRIGHTTGWLKRSQLGLLSQSYAKFMR